MRILILGGTTEASHLARLVAGRPDLAATLSLAGRTADPKPLPLPTRTGGFGGADGLARWIAETRTEAVVDATHPFAAQISRNAAEACGRTGVPLLGLRRPPWERVAGDRWIEVADMAAAVAALGARRCCVFLTVGRLELGAFAAAPQHRYVVRTIEPLDGALPVPDLVEVRDRGPFTLDRERALIAAEAVEVVVTKHSGGAATYPKLAAARECGLPVILIARPQKPAIASVECAEAALDWLLAHAGASTERGV